MRFSASWMVEWGDCLKVSQLFLFSAALFPPSEKLLLHSALGQSSHKINIKNCVGFLSSSVSKLSAALPQTLIPSLFLPLL